LKEFSNIRYLQGDVTDLPLEARSIDAAAMMLVLHHLREPERALSEAARVLRPGGVILVVDMVAHDRETYRHTMGHEHLGFEEAEMRSMGKHAGFDRITWRRLRPVATGKGPGLFAAAFFKGR
jgi:ubiquinone/menaquinone biosynthesis C-methylase UbiE